MGTFEEKLTAFDEATDHEYHDEDYDWMVESVETRETIDDFKASRENYRERGNLSVEGTVAGFPFVSYTKIQSLKGQTRRDLTVVDFGDRRIVLDADLYMYADRKSK